MKKLKTLKCALALLSVAFVSACGGNSTPEPTPDPDPTPEPTPDPDPTPTPEEDQFADYVDSKGVLKAKTSINLWSIVGTNNQPTLNKQIEEFMKIQPNIEVTSTIISGSYNDLKDATIKGFTGNNYPDLVQCYADHVAEYINYNKAVDLEPYMTSASIGWTDDEYNDLITDYLDEGREFLVDGTYCVPWCKSTEQMFYNEDVLVGLDLSKYNPNLNGGKALSKKYLESLTWDELFDNLCPAIEAHDKDVPEEEKLVKTDQAYHAIFAYDSDDNLFITLAKQYGYAYTTVDKETGTASVDFNNDGMKNILRKFNDAAKKGYIISKGSAGNNYTNTYFTLQNTLFSVGSTGGVKYQFDSANPMNVGVARIPQADVNNAYTINQGPSITVLNHNDENRKIASWLFYKFISNSENSTDWSLDTGYSPIRKSTLEDEVYADSADWKTKEAKSLERVMAYSRSKINDVGTLFTSPAFKGSSTCRTQAGGLMTKALTTTNNIEEIDKWFEDAVALCKAAL